MRRHGNLKKWIDDRGFGFIVTPQNNEEIFVHISAFPKDGVRPKIGELISFELQTDKNGKQRAVRIMRTAAAQPRRLQSVIKPKENGTPVRDCITVVLVLIVAYVSYNYDNSSQNSTVEPQKIVTPIQNSTEVPQKLTPPIPKIIK